jgi:tetratricopeptide (TPR) repeat protein/predicted Ser/Thr protein kinase
MMTQFGKYTIEKKLGAGGMGAVYLAVDQGLGRTVALKIITSDDPELLERFQREASAVAKLKHPNIVQVYEAGVIDKQHYFTMDYIEGASLDALIKSKNKASLQNLTKVIFQVATALHYAHQQNIVHRDIKPANILIDKTGKVFIADFGLAKQLAGLDRSLTVTGSTVGTPDYMPPEQAMGQKDQIDPRSDIFSLGATLYHCLTGRTPFSGQELLEVLTKVVNDDPPAPSAIDPAIPKDIETICLKCLEKDKGKRYQSASELALDIKRYLQGEPITGKRTSQITKLWLRARKNKMASIGLASAVLISLAVAIGLWVSSARTAGKLAQYRKEALAYSQEGKYDEARIACEKIREITKGDVEINALYDKCLTALSLASEQAAKRARAKKALDRASAAGTPDDKIRIAQEALNIDPTFGDAYQAIGYEYKAKFTESGPLQDKLRSDERRELINKAYEYFTKAIEATPTLAYSYYERALITAFQRNKPEAAIQDFEKVLELDRDSHIGWFAKGKIESQQGKYDQAIASYTQAIAKYPEYSGAYNNRGLVFYNKGDLDKAIADWTEAIRIDPKYDLAYNNRGNARSDKAEREPNPDAYRELIDGAIADYTEAIRLNPNLVHAYYNRGLALYNKAEFVKGGKSSDVTSGELIDGAIADYNETIKLDPNYAKAYTNRGNARADKGDLAGAMADYDEAIRLDPNYDAVYSNRGLARYNNNDLDGAIADYTEAIKLNPKSALAYTNCGSARSDKGDTDGAIADYNQAIKLDPKYASAYYNRANSFYAKGDLNEALADYDQAIRLDPKYAMAYNNRGLARSAKGDLDGAIADYTAVLGIDPKSVAAYTNRGSARSDKGDLAGAMADYDQAIRLNPKYAMAYYNRAIARSAGGDFEGAIADYTEVIKLNPKDAEAYNNRGLARYTAGDPDGAVADYTAALGIDPQSALAYANRGMALYGMQKYEPALADIQKALQLSPEFKDRLEPIAQDIKRRLKQ